MLLVRGIVRRFSATQKRGGRFDRVLAKDRSKNDDENTKLGNMKYFNKEISDDFDTSFDNGHGDEDEGDNMMMNDMMGDEDSMDFISALEEASSTSTYSSIEDQELEYWRKNHPSWPDTSHSLEFLDLLNVPVEEEYDPVKGDEIIKRAMKKMEREKQVIPFHTLKLPRLMKCWIRKKHSHYQVLSDMKYMLSRNPKLSVEQRDRIMVGIIMQVNEVLEDSEPVEFGFEDED